MCTQVYLLGFYSHSHHFHDVEGLSNQDLIRGLSRHVALSLFYTHLSYSSSRSSRKVLDRVRHLRLAIPEGKLT